MSCPKPEQFAEFFRAVNGYDPFPWQTRLALRVSDGDWPRAIALPTAAGKTGCIDIAVFALACRTKAAPRRIVFVVDRRIVVDQAKLHAGNLAKALLKPESRILQVVAESLRELAQDKRPLDVYALRGGTYRETAWARSPLQPTVITSTVDQVGSRLLFRGYGVSDSMKPIHAGLLANNALILLDEAHCSKPFDQTMQAIKKYRQWHDENELTTSFAFVSITATPAEEIQKAEHERKRERPHDRTLIEEAQDEDREHPILGKRICASKPAVLVVAEKAKGKNATIELVKMLEKHARELSNEFACVGIIVNRVKIARGLKVQLGDDAVLLTGRMRPLDREKLFEEKLKPLLSNAEGVPPKFVIGTQCLECGADFDFHALVTECASLDALRQRFGRLNRVANRPNAKAVIVIRGDQIEDTDEDPIYGASLANTWKLLESNAIDGMFDFGVAAVGASTSGVSLDPLNAPTEDALVLLPGHLDCLVQTNPTPKPDLIPGWFLHGFEKPGQPDVQVVFRRDLGMNTDLWADIVSLCPPSSSEAVPVPIGVFKKWLTEEELDDSSGDVEGEVSNPEGEDQIARAALRWNGPTKSQIVVEPNQVTPNDLYIISSSAEGAKELGDFPYDLTDDAEEAFQGSRDRALLRLTESKLIEDDDGNFDALLTQQIQNLLQENPPDWLTRAVEELANPKRREVEAHPLGGWVVSGNRRLYQFDPTHLDDSEPEDSFRGRAVKLREHSGGVAEYAQHFAEGCGLDAKLYSQAGLWHDLGKLDPRFQAMLKDASPRTAVGEPLAKSEQSPRTKRERDESRQIHCYPVGGRHELLSAALVATKTDDDLLLHLIATHHGSARPFADHLDENDATKAPFSAELFGQSFELPTSAQQIGLWNAELPERFWRVVRKYGWWGSAYREAVFRLADHAQSRAEQDKPDEIKKPKLLPAKPSPLVLSGRECSLHPLHLSGLDGGNPLAFLATLGTLVLFDRIARSDDRPEWLNGAVALSWQGQTPLLHFPGELPSSEKLAEFLGEQCVPILDKHPAKFVVSLFENKESRTSRLREFVQSSIASGRAELDWIAAHFSEIAEEGTSQLMTVRRDYFPDNLRSILSRCKRDHIYRTLFKPWDYADALDNQSLHWEPSEDRRHAYQWNMPSGDPARKKRGGMLGANRLALEAWPLFPSIPVGKRLTTRGFKGNRATNTFWTWPLWRLPLTRDAIASMLGLPHMCAERVTSIEVRDFGIHAVFRLQRILVGKTPNFTAAGAIT